MIIYVIFFGKEEKDLHRVKKSELNASTNTEVKEEKAEAPVEKKPAKKSRFNKFNSDFNEDPNDKY